MNTTLRELLASIKHTTGSIVMYYIIEWILPYPEITLQTGKRNNTSCFITEKIIDITQQYKQRWLPKESEVVPNDL